MHSWSLYVVLCKLAPKWPGCWLLGERISITPEQAVLFYIYHHNTEKLTDLPSNFSTAQSPLIKYNLSAWYRFLILTESFTVPSLV